MSTRRMASQWMIRMKMRRRKKRYDKMVNGLNSKINYFTKQKMVSDCFSKFKHFSCSKFCQIRKYAEVIKIHIQTLIKYSKL